MKDLGIQKEASWAALWERVKEALSGIPGLKVAARHTDKVDPNSMTNIYFGQGDHSAFYLITRHAACRKKNQIDRALRDALQTDEERWLESECYRMVPTRGIL